jgi:nucleotide-binding universal stress UspA family protein
MVQMENTTNPNALRILVPHDGSEMSDRALHEAERLAKALKQEMVLLHVVDNTFIPPSASLGFFEQSALEDTKAELIKILREGAEQMLKDRTAKVKEKGINVKFLIDTGSTVEVILSVAKNEKVNIIVMGSRQLTGAGKIKVLGSVARRVSEQAECPVMIVR